MKSKMWTILSLFVVMSMLVACAAVPAAPAAPVAEEPAAEEPVAEDMSWWAQAAETAGCVGTTITGISESTPPSNYSADVIAPQFEEESGIKVEFETTSWGEMYDKELKDMQSGAGVYDFIYIEQDIAYAYIDRDFLSDVTQMRIDNPELAFSDFDEGMFVSFVDYFRDPENGNLMGVPMEAFIKTYLYRTDLFEDEEIKAAFEAEYGYPLAPATDHEEYSDIAKFFTEWGETNDMELWGTTVQAHTGHAASWYEGFTEVPPQFGVYDWGINMDNWKATVENGGTMNSDENKAALTWWLSNLEFAPPEATSSTWDETAATFAAGRVAQGLIYGENAAWVATDPERSIVVGNVGVALPPTEPGVLDAAAAGEGSVGYYDGGAYGIPVSSQNPLCALLWVQYFAQEQFQPEWAAASARVTHNATYDSPELQAMDEQTNGYFTLMKDKGELFAGASPFPFHATLREEILPIWYKAITGDLTPDETLDQMAEATDAFLVELGYGE
ncbi:MAG: extracellular solute-binding protein [Chloroflexi bacterium]|nr:extracellular solute-binding protein [Chloroflexota bacterium]